MIPKLNSFLPLNFLPLNEEITQDLIKNKKKITIASSSMMLGMLLIFILKIFFQPEHAIPINPLEFNSEYNNKLVYFSHKTNEIEVADSIFKFTHKTSIARRIVEKYQWKNISEGKFAKIWSPEYIDNTQYNKKEFLNSKEFFFKSKYLNDNSFVGVFKIPSIFDNIFKYKKVDYNESFFKKLPESGQKAFKILNGMLYYSKQPSSPAIGDLRIYFEAADPSVISVLAKQHNKDLLPYTENNNNIFLFKTGSQSLELLSKNANLNNSSAIRYIFYIIGYLIILGGFSLIGIIIFPHIKNELDKRKGVVNTVEESDDYDDPFGEEEDDNSLSDVAIIEESTDNSPELLNEEDSLSEENIEDLLKTENKDNKNYTESQNNNEFPDMSLIDEEINIQEENSLHSLNMDEEHEFNLVDPNEKINIDENDLLNNDDFAMSNTNEDLNTELSSTKENDLLNNDDFAISDITEDLNTESTNTEESDFLNNDDFAISDITEEDNSTGDTKANNDEEKKKKSSNYIKWPNPKDIL